MYLNASQTRPLEKHVHFFQTDICINLVPDSKCLYITSYLWKFLLCIIYKGQKKTVYFQATHTSSSFSNINVSFGRESPMASHIGALFSSTHSLLQPKTTAFERQRMIWQAGCLHWLLFLKMTQMKHRAMPVSHLISLFPLHSSWPILLKTLSIQFIDHTNSNHYTK